MKDIINKLSSHNTLSKDEAKEVLLNISKGKYNNSHISSVGAPLADGWVRQQDPTSQAMYYRHVASGHVQWDLPM